MPKNICNFYGQLSKIQSFTTGILNEGDNPNKAQKDVAAMMKKDKSTIQHQFDAYIKKALRGEACDHKAERARVYARETVFSELPEEILESLCVYDDYPCERRRFSAGGYVADIRDDALAYALEQLPARKRDVVILAYMLGFNDAEIGRILHLMASTVHYHRTSSLKQIKKRMEEFYAQN